MYLPICFELWKGNCFLRKLNCETDIKRGRLLERMGIASRPQGFDSNRLEVVLRDEGRMSPSERGLISLRGRIN